MLVRLRACAVEVYRGKQIYGRGLLTGFLIDDASRHIKVSVDPEIISVYATGWTGIDWDQRQQLRGKPLALWLHGYYASHAEPLPVKVDTLRQLCGSKTKTLYSFRQKLREALKALAAEDVGAIETWQIDDNDLVHVDRGKAITSSQRRHLMRPKRARKTKK